MLSKFHIGTLLITLLISVLGFGQSTFNNYYQSGSLSLANKINYVSQNQFILSSYYVDSASGQQGLDLKLINNLGQTQLRKRHLFRDCEYLSFANSNVQTDISNSTMLLTAATGINGESGVIFTSVNKSTLDTNWAKYYSDGVYNYYLNNVFKTKPNEVWFMGDRANNNGYTSRPTVLKTDTLGNLLSIKEFTNMVGYLATSVYFDETNNLLYIAGRNAINPAVQQSYIACTDTLGNIIWNQQIGNNPYLTDVYQIAKRNNYLILSGFKISSIVGSSVRFKLCLVKLNSSNGSQLWNKTYGSEGWNNLKGFVINNDESITACGMMQFPSLSLGPNPNGVLFKANSNGDSLWLKSFSTYTGNVFEQFLDLQATPNGGYVTCGGPSSTQISHSWVVMTDSVGNAPGMFTYTAPPTGTTTNPGGGTVTAVFDLQTNGVGFNVFPNPVDNLLTIEFTENSNPQPYTSIQLYNSFGQLLIEEKLIAPKNIISLKTDHLERGIYFLKFNDIVGNNVTKKVIISR